MTSGSGAAGGSREASGACIAYSRSGARSRRKHDGRTPRRLREAQRFEPGPPLKRAFARGLCRLLRLFDARTRPFRFVAKASHFTQDRFSGLFDLRQPLPLFLPSTFLSARGHCDLKRSVKILARDEAWWREVDDAVVDGSTIYGSTDGEACADRYIGCGAQQPPVLKPFGPQPAWPGTGAGRC